MTCKHNWHFLDGLVKRIRCTRCEDTRFVNKMDEYLITAPHGKYTLADTRPNNIIFYATHKETQHEVMRISPEGVTSNPAIPTDEGAQALIRALDMYIKAMVQKEYERGMVDGRAVHKDLEVALSRAIWDRQEVEALLLKLTGVTWIPKSNTPQQASDK